MENAALPHDKDKRAGTLISSSFIVVLLLSTTWIAIRPLASAAVSDHSFVVLVRHGDAPGRGEPDGFDLRNCNTQRNLSDKGRNQARELGAKLRASGVIVTKVLTSQWCRARETAELLKLAPIENATSFDDLALNKQRTKELLDGERNLIDSWHGPGVLLIVSHSSNIKALTDIDLEEGAMIVVSSMHGRLLAKPFSTLSRTQG
jgi:phosphohistidine phosphatase SixA